MNIFKFQILSSFLNLIKVFVLTTLFFAKLSAHAQKQYAINRYPSGSIKSHGWINNNQKQEHWHYYYKDSIIKEKGFYKNNLKNGYWKTFYKNKAIASQGAFKDGKKEGYWTFY